MDPRPQGCHQQVQAQPRASHPPRREGSAAVRGGLSPGCVSNTGGDPQFRHRGSSSTKAVGRRGRHQAGVKARSAWRSHPLLSRSGAGSVPALLPFCCSLPQEPSAYSHRQNRGCCQSSAANFQPPPRSGPGCARSYPISFTSARTPFPHRGWISLELTQLSWKLCLSRTCGFQSAALTGTKPGPCTHRAAFPSAQQHSRELALQERALPSKCPNYTVPQCPHCILSITSIAVCPCSQMEPGRGSALQDLLCAGLGGSAGRAEALQPGGPGYTALRGSSFPCRNKSFPPSPAGPSQPRVPLCFLFQHLKKKTHTKKKALAAALLEAAGLAVKAKLLRRSLG